MWAQFRHALRDPLLKGEYHLRLVVTLAGWRLAYTLTDLLKLDHT